MICWSMADPTHIRAAVADFEERLVAAVAVMESLRTPAEFCEAERRLHALSQAFADKLTADVLRRVSADTERRRAATDDLRKRAGPIKLRSQGFRSTTIRLLGGSMADVETPYMYAAPIGPSQTKRGKSGTGVYPVLDELGISGRSTPALRLRVAMAVAEAGSVATARQLMSEHGLDLEHKTALRLTYHVCDVATQARNRCVKETNRGNDNGEFVGRRIVACVDGGRINIRKGKSGAPPKGGRRAFTTDWREPKVLTIYALDEHGRRDKRVPSIIDATLGDADAVFRLMRYYLRNVGAHRAEELILIGDGAKWIWKRADRLRQDLNLPKERFTEVVDYFHAVERLYTFARSRPGWSESKAVRWAVGKKAWLKAGKVEKIEESIAKQLTATERKKGAQLPYWRRNRHRLRFACHRQRRVPNGSGAVESAVRRVLNLRMKGPSTFWTEEHAEGVIHIRAHLKAGRWAELERVVLENSCWRPHRRRRRGRRKATFLK